MNLKGWGDRELWVSEIGWPGDPNYPIDQALGNMGTLPVLFDRVTL